MAPRACGGAQVWGKLGASASSRRVCRLASGVCTPLCVQDPEACAFLCMHILGSVHIPLLTLPSTHTQTLACTNPRVSTFSYVHDLEDVLGSDSVRICVCTGPGVHGHVHSGILVVHRSRCLRGPGMYVDPRVQAPLPLSGPRTRFCFRPVLDSFALAQFTCKA